MPRKGYMAVPRVNIYLDFDNLYVGLMKRGWNFDLQSLVSAIREEVSSLGQVAQEIAYADWELLKIVTAHKNLQQETAALGIETRYQVNMRGKSDEDTKIAVDIRDRIEQDDIDLIILATSDCGYEKLMQTVRDHQKQMIMLSPENRLQPFLRQTSVEALDLDQHFIFQPTSSQQPSGDASNKMTSFILATLHTSRYRLISYEKLAEELQKHNLTVGHIDKAKQSGILLARTQPSDKEDEPHKPANTVILNREAPTVSVFEHLMQLRTRAVQRLLDQNKMPYVEIGLLVQGMRMDNNFQDCKTPQDPHASENNRPSGDYTEENEDND